LMNNLSGKQRFWGHKPNLCNRVKSNSSICGGFADSL
jgi:hypothetical protein